MDEKTAQTEQQRRTQQLKMEQLRRQQILLQQENKRRQQVEQKLGAEVASVMKKENSGETRRKPPKPLSDTTLVRGEFGDCVMVDAMPKTPDREEKKIKPEITAGEKNQGTVMKELPEEAGITEDKNGDQSREERWEHLGKTGQWFQTFCWMHIPIFGFFYMLVLSLREKTPEEKKAFARAYVLYRVLVMILACTLIYVVYKVGLDFVDQMLAYVGG